MINDVDDIFSISISCNYSNHIEGIAGFLVVWGKTSKQKGILRKKSSIFLTKLKDFLKNSTIFLKKTKDFLKIQAIFFQNLQEIGKSIYLCLRQNDKKKPGV